MQRHNQRMQLPSLRVGSHNIRGFGDVNGSAAPPRMRALLLEWERLKLGIVCLQETHASVVCQYRIETWLLQLSRDAGFAGWEVFWAHSGGSAGGVAVLVRRSLLRTHQLVVHADQVWRSANGRLLAVPMDWGGHKLCVASVYLHSGDDTAKRNFMRKDMQDLVACMGSRVHVWCGDWNFVHGCITVERRSLQADLQAQVSSHHDVGTARVFSAQFPNMVDVFRHLHAHARSFTHVTPTSAARLDRIYVSEQVLPCLAQCCTSGATVSDHRLVMMALTARQPCEFGPGLPRVRMHFWQHAHLRSAFTTWLVEQLGLAPEGGLALITWWLDFKGRMARYLQRLNVQARECVLQLQHNAAAARDALDAAREDLNAGVDGALAAAVQAHQQYAAATKAAQAGAVLKARKDWLHVGERPSPVMTAMLRPPQGARAIPALRTEAGVLVNGPRRLPNVMVRYWARVSAASDPPGRAAAQHDVLDAMAEQQEAVLTPEVDNEVGSHHVDEDEVVQAMRGSRAGTAPGADGIPLELYRKAAQQFAPFLAKVFTAIGELQSTDEALPREFLLGVITVLHKKGDRTAPANYRPITLLNTDYRLLAKVLATRLGQVLGMVIGREQAAFLPGRCIGDNIQLLRLLPHVLRQQLHARPAAVAFLDFHKAYDTVDRSFLFACMHALGLGPKIVGWARMLLSDTRAVALVNGHVSHAVPFTAGVRQGCPLSPALYLCVGQALLCWLQHTQVAGIEVEGVPGPLVGGQYADDIHAFLKSLDAPAVAAFMQAMGTFGLASGQRLNTDKCRLMHVGLPLQRVGAHVGEHVGQGQDGPPQHVHGMPVVHATTCLGLQFSDAVDSAGAASGVDWEGRMVGVRECYGRLSRFGLSAFGRGFACSSYGVSTLLYHAEFAGPPPAACVAELHDLSRVLVDCDHLLNSHELCDPPGFGDRPVAAAGVEGEGVGAGLMCPASHLLYGSPKDGGFGMLPWQHHIVARHACWAVRYVMSAYGPDPGDRPAWMQLLDCHLRCMRPPQHALMLFSCTRGAVLHSLYFPGGELLPYTPLRRLVEGLLALPPLSDVGLDDLVPGAWCVNCPLWGNPALTAARVAAGCLHADQPLEVAFEHLLWVRGLRTIGDALDTLRSVTCFSAMSCEQWRRKLQVLVMGPTSARDAWRQLCFDGLVQDTAKAVQCFTDLVAALPQAWCTAARQAMHDGVQLPSMDEVVRDKVLPRLGWPAAALAEGGAGVRPGDRPVMLSALSVKAATRLQLGDVRALRWQRMCGYVGLILGPAVQQVVVRTEAGRLKGVLKGVWKLPWENGRKEVLWRLVLDGLPKYRDRAGGMCSCGHAGVGVEPREHVFWSCSVARAVVEAVQRELHGLPGVGLITREHVWLLKRPAPHVHVGVWRVVCLAALGAMYSAHRYLHKLVKHEHVDAHGACQRAGRWAVLRMWELLSDFVALQVEPPPVGALGVGHPYIARMHGGDDGAPGRIVVHRA